MITSEQFDRLVDLYPKIFKSFCGYFNVGTGWYSLVEDLCLVLDGYDLINKSEIFQIIEVENKFGVLNICYTGGDDLVERMVHFAERLSYKTCEECGSPGTLFSSDGTRFGHLTTLCKKHGLIKFKRIYDFGTPPANSLTS